MLEAAIRDKYTVIIGLEVHAQLLTETKMFSSEAISYGNMPNTQVSTVTLAHPGTLPRINKKAVEFAIKMGLACKASIARYNLFARKNYFYPDLTKGYQITQDKTPICYEGEVAIDLPGGSTKTIGIQRIHMEEDTGKSIHDIADSDTLIDYNRAGVPLIEIVSKPDLRSSEEAYQLLTEIRKLVRYLEICDGNMEEGSLRCDANVSVMLKGAKEWGQKVEVKNMNSIRNVQFAIEHEIVRQIQLLERGEKIASETRSYDAAKGHTIRLRVKEGMSDYRYFPDPDLSPLIVEQEWIDTLKASMPMLPRECFEKFVSTYQLPAYDASVLSENKEIALFYEALCQETSHYKAASNWVMGPVKSYLNELKVGIDQFPVSAKTLAALIELVEHRKVSFSVASQQIYPVLLQTPEKDPETIAETLGLLHERDSAQLEAWVDEVLAAFPDKVEAYKGGKKGLLGMFMGEVMKKSGNKVDPKEANDLLREKLDA